MSTLQEREQNLFNAIETMAQFYDEIESFFGILYGNMEGLGFAVKSERLRSGTFTVKNLTRRLLATASLMYIQDSIQQADVDDVEDDEAIEAEEKAGKDTDITITSETKIPLATLHLFTPRTIPTGHTLNSPLLLIGALGNFEFIEKKTGKPSKPPLQTIGLANLGQIYLKPNNQAGSTLGVSCRKTKEMRKYKVQGELLGFEKLKLLEIDSQEKIKGIADKLAGFCQK